ncbi:MAG: tetratricopeptide repeat protein [Chitinivibrionales bacterium]|nr:tetratricopeptide repeat protein [Chitinivibrionales bacterium]
MSRRIILFLIFSFLLTTFNSCSYRHKFPVVRPVRKHTHKDLARFRAESYFVKARDYDRRGLTMLAERFYEMAYELDPQSAILKDILIRKYIESSKFTKALLLLKGDRKLSRLSEKEKRILTRIYIGLGQFHRAIETLDALTVKTDKELYSLALMYENIPGGTPKAIKHYSRFLKNNPDAMATGLKIGALYLKEENYAAAESLYIELDKRFEKKPDILNGLGLVNILKGDTALAIDFFKTALIVDSTYENAARNLGQIHIGKGKYPDAIRYYEKLYNGSPIGSIYGKTLSLLYYYNEQYAESERIIRKLLEIGINDHELHFYFGLVAAAQDKNDLARMEYEKAIALQPQYDEAWRQMCYLTIKEKEWNQALSVARRFTKALPEFSASWRMLGYVYNMREEYEEAVPVLEKAISLDSSDSHGYFELGSSLERMGKIDAAAEMFKKVLQLKPQDPAASNYLGYMWAENDMKLDSAEKLLETALEKEPENGAYLDSYAWMFYKKGHYDKALKYITKALEYIDDDPVIYEHLADIHAKRNEYRKALESYRECLELNPEEVEKIQKKIEELEKKLSTNNAQR